MLDFTTAAMRPEEGREAWVEQLAALCGRRAILRFRPETFRGSIRHREVGGISLCHFAHNVSEMRQNGAPQSVDRCRHMMLIMQLSGRSQLAQGASDMTLEAGELALIDSFRPFTTRFQGATTQLIAYLPAAELAAFSSMSALSRSYRVSGRDGIAALARSTMLAIARTADRFPDADASHAREMLTGIARHMMERERRATVPVDHGLPDRRIRAFIDARLADAQLSPAQVASGCGISLRRLHRAFAESDWSVCGWIRHRRLEQCRHDLLDPAHDRLTITQIAFRWGFNDAAHFSRCFREAYGQSPRDLRRRAA